MIPLLGGAWAMFSRAGWWIGSIAAAGLRSPENSLRQPVLRCRQPAMMMSLHQATGGRSDLLADHRHLGADMTLSPSCRSA